LAGLIERYLDLVVLGGARVFLLGPADAFVEFGGVFGPSWFDKAIGELLQRGLKGCCLCVVDRLILTRGIAVRVVNYSLDGVDNAENICRLVTTILDPQAAPAEELAALYHERWEIESALDELKTHLRGSRIVLRSRTPDLVRQEFYGLLMLHYAVHGVMHEAAIKADIDPDRSSFLHAVRVIRRKCLAAGAVPPSGPSGMA
jgi:hypothetical protein